MGLKPDQGMIVRRLWAGGWLFSNMSFTASFLTHARSIIFVKPGARKNVSSNSYIYFFASGLGLLYAGCPKCLAFFWIRNFRKLSYLL
jgi:hypothetical protein